MLEDPTDLNTARVKLYRWACSFDMRLPPASKNGFDCVVLAGERDDKGSPTRACPVNSRMSVEALGQSLRGPFV